MSLKNYSHEEIQHMSMIEVASLILLDEKKAFHFKDVFDKIAELKGFTDGEKEANIAQFYTDLNVDGRFITTGSNMWGLKRWYPVEQMDEEVTVAPKKKKKAKKKKEEDVEDDLDVVEDDLEIFEDDFDIDDMDEEIDEEFDEEFDENDEDYEEDDDDNEELER